MNSAYRSLALVLLVVVGATAAQTGVNTTPSRATLDEASRASCDGVSVVVQRCVAQPDDAATKAPDALTKSRANAKAAFDRRDSRARAAALKGETPAPTTAEGDAQRLGGVSVTGKADDPALSIEQVLQRALNPNSDGTLSPDGKTISRYGLNGSRYDCIAKCVGPACCTEVRALPNPARESNSIGR